MAIRQTCIAGAAILASLISGSAGADEPRSVRIPDQTVSSRAMEPAGLHGIFRDGEYAGVSFYAEPDASIPLPPEYQPEALLAKLDPALKVESVGSPPFSGPKDREEILSALPHSAFRLKLLIAPDGQSLVEFRETLVVVYVTRYGTAPGYTPSLEDLLEARSLKENRVYISAYNVAFGDLPPCSGHSRLCSAPK